MKSSRLIAHFSGQVIERLASDVGINAASADLKRLDVNLGQQGVVVEHLFEVRHQPFRVHAVTRESAADVISNATRRHVIECQGRRVDQRWIFPAVTASQ